MTSSSTKTDKLVDQIRIGQTLLNVGFSNFSVYEKLNTQRITGLRGTSSNLPTGRNMIHVDFRWILSGKKITLDNRTIVTDFDQFTDIIAQFRASPFLPFRNDVLSALVSQFDPSLTQDNPAIASATLGALKDSITQLGVTKNTVGLALIAEGENIIFGIEKVYKVSIGVDNDITTIYTFEQLLKGHQNLTKNAAEHLNTYIDRILLGNFSITSLDTHKRVDEVTQAKIKALIKQTLANGGLTSNFVTLLDIIDQQNNANKTLKQIQNSVNNSKPLAERPFISGLNEPGNKNVHLAATQIEWTTVPELKIGVVVKLSCIYFNHFPHITRIKYHKGADSTFNLEDCTLFTRLKDRYVSDHKEPLSIQQKITSLRVRSRDDDRCNNVCQPFDLAKAQDGQNSTTVSIGLYTWEVPKEAAYSDIPELDADIRKVADQKVDTVTYLRPYSREFSETIKTMQFGTNDAFIERITCSLNFPYSIIPLQGNQHPTLQFYGRPEGSVQIQLSYSDMDKLDSNSFVVSAEEFIANANKSGPDNYACLRFFFEEHRQYHNKGLTKHLRFNPTVILSPLVNMGGMYNFNFEDLSSQNVSGQPGTVNTIVTFQEQHIPSMDREEQLNGFVQVEDHSNQSSHKLKEVFNFLASKKIEGQFNENYMELFRTRAEIVDLLSDSILTPDVWYYFSQRWHFPDMFKHTEQNTLSNVFESTRTREQFASFMTQPNRFFGGMTDLSAENGDVKEATDDFFKTFELDAEEHLEPLRIIYECTDILGTLKNMYNGFISSATVGYSKVAPKTITFGEQRNNLSKSLYNGTDLALDDDPLSFYGINGPNFLDFVNEFVSDLTVGLFEGALVWKGESKRTEENNKIIWTLPATLRNESELEEQKEGVYFLPTNLMQDLVEYEQKFGTIRSSYQYKHVYDILVGMGDQLIEATYTNSDDKPFSTINKTAIELEKKREIKSVNYTDFKLNVIDHVIDFMKTADYSSMTDSTLQLIDSYAAWQMLFWFDRGANIMLGASAKLNTLITAAEVAADSSLPGTASEVRAFISRVSKVKSFAEFKALFTAADTLPFANKVTGYIASIADTLTKALEKGFVKTVGGIVGRNILPSLKKLLIIGFSPLRLFVATVNLPTSILGGFASSAAFRATGVAAKLAAGRTAGGAAARVGSIGKAAKLLRFGVAIPFAGWILKVIEIGASVFLTLDKAKQAQMLATYMTYQYGLFYSSFIHKMIHNNLIPNDEVLVQLAQAINTHSIVGPGPSRALDAAYDVVNSFGSKSKQDKPVSRRISAYPDMNLPTYKELAAGGAIIDIPRATAAVKRIRTEFESYKILLLADEKYDAAAALGRADAALGLMETRLDELKKPNISDYRNLVQNFMAALSVVYTISTDRLHNGKYYNLSERLKNPLFVGNAALEVDKAVVELVSVLEALVPESLVNLVPRFEESPIETPYVLDPFTNPGNIYSRDVHDYVDPGFYIIRQTKDPYAALINDKKILAATDPDNVWNYAKLVSGVGDKGGMGSLYGPTFSKPTVKLPSSFSKENQLENMDKNIKNLITNGSIGIVTAANYYILSESEGDYKLLKVLKNAADRGRVEAAPTPVNIPVTEEQAGVIRTSIAAFEAGTLNRRQFGYSMKDVNLSHDIFGLGDELITVIKAESMQERSRLTTRNSTYFYEMENLHRNYPNIKENIRTAFPTYMVFFIRENENHYYERHLMADVFLYQNVIDIDIHSNKYTGSVATLTLANIWGTLDNDTYRNTARPRKGGEIIRQHDIEKQLGLSEVRLSPGTLIEIRHGYAANIEELHIVFTGKIVEVTPGDVVTLICQGHEHELMNQVRSSLDVGVTTGRNMYDYCAQLMSHTKHFGSPFSSRETRDLIEHKRMHASEVYGDDGAIGSFELFLESNLRASRTTDNIWVGNHAITAMDYLLNNDFTLKDTSHLEALHEISRYHYDHVAYPLPYDSRATMFVGPPDHIYKYTGKKNKDSENFVKANSMVSRYLTPEDDLINITLPQETPEDKLLLALIQLIRASKIQLIRASTKRLLLFSDKSNLPINKALFEIVVYEKERIPTDTLVIDSTINYVLTPKMDKIRREATTSNGELHDVNLNPWRVVDSSTGLVELGIPNAISLESEFGNVPIKFKTNVAYRIMSTFIEQNKQIIQESQRWAKVEELRHTSAVRDLKQQIKDLENKKEFLEHVNFGNRRILSRKAFKLETVSEAQKRSNETRDDLGLTIKKLKDANDALDKIGTRDWNDIAAENLLNGVVGSSSIINLVRAFESSNADALAYPIFEQLLNPEKYNIRASIIKLKILYGIIMAYASSTLDNSTSDAYVKSSTEAAIQRNLLATRNAQVLPPGYKPFRTYHSISDRDIIANQIECTTSQMANEVHVMTPQNEHAVVGKLIDGTKVLIGIDPTLSQSYWRTNITSFSMFQLPSEKLIRRIYEPNAFRANQQQNIAYRDLAEAMKPMYRGQLILTGRRDIKPFDVIFLNDRYNSIYGPIEVESVIHHHSLQSGWITTIVPHLLNTHAVKESSALETSIRVALGLVETAANLLLLRSMATGAYKNIMAQVAGNGKLTERIIAGGTSVFFQDILLPAFAIGFADDLKKLAEDVIFSDALMNKLWFTPAYKIHGSGISPEDYAELRSKLGDGNTPFPDHAKPVILDPLTKDGRPWLAGLKGIRPYDTSGSYGTLGALSTMGYDDFARGIRLSGEDLSIGLGHWQEGIKTLFRNFFLNSGGG